MQSNPRILVNLLVILVNVLVNLLVKLTKLGQGGHGGANPLYEPLPGCIPPPQRGVRAWARSTARGNPFGARLLARLLAIGQTYWLDYWLGYWLDYQLLARLLARLLALLVRPTGNISQTIGLLAIARLYKLFTDLSDFLGITSSHWQSFIHMATSYTSTCFFSR